MKYIVLLSIILLTSFVSFEANSQVPARQWETFINTNNYINDFFHGKRIAQYKLLKGFLVAINSSDSFPTFAHFDSSGVVKKVFMVDFKHILYGQYRTNFSDVHKMTLTPYSDLMIRSMYRLNDTLGRYLSVHFLWYEEYAGVPTTGGLMIDTNLRKSFTTIARHNRSIFSSLIFDTTYVKNSETTTNEIMKILHISQDGRKVRQYDSVCRFTYTNAQFPLMPYPFAVFQEDTNSYYVLHAPDTLYLGTIETGIRITKHNNQDFHLEETFIPNQQSLFSTLPFDPNPYYKKYVPKFHSVSTAGYVIVGNALDSIGMSTPIVLFSRFDNTISYTKYGSRIATINSCRVRDDGTVVAVGTTKNGIQGSDDFYMIIVRPDGGKLEEYVWGGAFDDNLADVTYTDNGDIVVSGNAGPNCYVARIATDNPTSVNESVPFSSTIGFAPNPASSQTLVRFAPTTDGIATAELFDMRGMKVKQLFSEPVQRGNEYTFPAPVSDVPNGVYTVIITNGITKHYQQLQIIR